MQEQQSCYQKNHQQVIVQVTVIFSKRRKISTNEMNLVDQLDQRVYIVQYLIFSMVQSKLMNQTKKRLTQSMSKKKVKAHCQNDLKCKLKEQDQHLSQDDLLVPKKDLFKKTQENFNKKGKDVYIVDKKAFTKLTSQQWLNALQENPLVKQKKKKQQSKKKFKQENILIQCIKAKDQVINMNVKQLEVKEAQLSEYHMKINQIEDEKTKIQIHCNELKTQLEEEREKKGEFIERVKQLEENLQNQDKVMESTQKNFRFQKESLNDREKKLQEEICQLKQTNQKIQDESQKYENQNLQFQQKIQSYQESLRQSNQTIDSLHIELNKKNSQIFEKNQVIQMQQNQIECFEQEQEQKEQRIRQLQKALQFSEDKTVNDLKENLENLKKENEQLLQQIDVDKMVKEKIDNFEKLLEKSQVYTQDLEEEIMKLNKEKENLFNLSNFQKNTILNLEERYSTLQNFYQNGNFSSKFNSSFYEALQKKIDFLESKNKSLSRPPLQQPLNPNHKNYLRNLQDNILEMKKWYSKRYSEDSKWRKINEMQNGLKRWNNQIINSKSYIQK